MERTKNSHQGEEVLASMKVSSEKSSNQATAEQIFAPENMLKLSKPIADGLRSITFYFDPKRQKISLKEISDGFYMVLSIDEKGKIIGEADNGVIEKGAVRGSSVDPSFTAKINRYIQLYNRKNKEGMKKEEIYADLFALFADSFGTIALVEKKIDNQGIVEKIISTPQENDNKLSEKITEVFKVDKEKADQMIKFVRHKWSKKF